MKTLPPQHPVLLFDGVCNLCSWGVNFVMDHDPDGYFHFAAQQSPVGQALARRYGLPAEAMKSVILIEGERFYMRSTAALRTCRHLRGAARWPWLLVALPAPVRDAVYDYVARNRYRWFGRREACRMPTAETAGRFLDGPPPARVENSCHG